MMSQNALAGSMRTSVCGLHARAAVVTEPIEFRLRHASLNRQTS
jgi:hypothetical protein